MTLGCFGSYILFVKVPSKMAFSFESMNTGPEERFRDFSRPVTDVPKRMINNSSPRQGPTINHTFIRHEPQLTAVFFRYFRIYHARKKCKGKNVFYRCILNLANCGIREAFEKHILLLIGVSKIKIL